MSIILVKPILMKLYPLVVLVLVEKVSREIIIYAGWRVTFVV